MAQQLLEAFNSEPYAWEKVEKNGMMDIVYSFTDEQDHSYRYHFEKRVNYGRNVFVVTLGQKAPSLKMYKRVFGKFANPLRVIATLIEVVKDVKATRHDVKGIILEVPEQAFGAHGKLVDRILKRELRTELNVEDMEFEADEFETLGLKGTVATLKPNRFKQVFTGKLMQEILDKRAAAGNEYVGADESPVAVQEVPKPASAFKNPAKQGLQPEISTNHNDKTAQLQIDTRYDGVWENGKAYRVRLLGFPESNDKNEVVAIMKKSNFKFLSPSMDRLIFAYPADKAANLDSDLSSAVDSINARTEYDVSFGERYVGINHSIEYKDTVEVNFSSPTELSVAKSLLLSSGINLVDASTQTPRRYILKDESGVHTSKSMDEILTPLIGVGRIASERQDAQPAVDDKSNFLVKTRYDGEYQGGKSFQITMLKPSDAKYSRKAFFDIMNEYGFESEGKAGDNQLLFSFPSDDNVISALTNSGNTLKRNLGINLDISPIEYTAPYVVKPESSGAVLCFSIKDELDIAFDILLAAGIEDTAKLTNGMGEDKYRLIHTKPITSEAFAQLVEPHLGKAQRVDATTTQSYETVTYKTKDGLEFDINGRKLTFKKDMNFAAIMQYVFGWFNTEFKSIDDKRQFVHQYEDVTENFIGVLQNTSITEAISNKVSEQFDKIISDTHRQLDLSSTMYDRNINATEEVISDYRDFKGVVSILDGGVGVTFYSKTGPFAKRIQEQFGGSEYSVVDDVNILRVNLDGKLNIKEYDARIVGLFLKASDDNYAASTKRSNPVKVFSQGKVTFRPSQTDATLSLTRDVACYLVGMDSREQKPTTPSSIRFDNINTLSEFYDLCDALDDYDFEGNFLKAFRCSKYINDAKANGGELKVAKNGKEVSVSIQEDMIFVNLTGMTLPAVDKPFWKEGEGSAFFRTFYMGSKSFNDAMVVLDNFLDKELSEAAGSEIAGNVDTAEQKFHFEHQKGGFKIVTEAPFDTLKSLLNSDIDLTDNGDGSVYVKLSHFSKTVGTKKGVAATLTASGYTEGEHKATPGSAAAQPKVTTVVEPVTSINWSTADTALKGQYFKDSNYKVVNMKVDELISRQASDFRIDAGIDINRIKGRAERALAHITSGAPMDMPVVEIDNQGNLQVVDGRHRIAVAKEMGLKEIPVFLSNADDDDNLQITMISKFKYDYTLNGKVVATAVSNLEGDSWSVHDPKSGIRLVGWPNKSMLFTEFEKRYTEYRKTKVKGDNKPVSYSNSAESGVEVAKEMGLKEIPVFLNDASSSKQNPSAKYAYSMHSSDRYISLEASDKSLKAIEKYFNENMLKAFPIYTISRNSSKELIVKFHMYTSASVIQQASEWIIDAIGQPTTETGVPEVDALRKGDNKFEIAEQVQAMRKKGKPFILAPNAKTLTKKGLPIHGVLLLDIDGNGRFYKTHGESITIAQAMNWKDKFDIKHDIKSAFSKLKGGKGYNGTVRLFDLSFDATGVKIQNVVATETPKLKLFNDLTIKLAKQGGLPQKTINVKGDDVFITKLSMSGMYNTEERNLSFLMDSNPLYTSIDNLNAEVKRRLLQLVGSSAERIKSAIESWTNGRIKVESVRGSGVKMNESIKEDLTGAAPKINKVKKSLLESAMRQMGIYHSFFGYGGASFATSINEGVVDILPTQGNIDHLQKMLGIKLGHELVKDARGGLCFDIS